MGAFGFNGGVQAVPTSSGAVGANLNGGSIYVANGTGTITSYAAYMDGSTGGSSVIPCLYAWDGTKATTLIAKGSAQTISSGGGAWKTIAWTGGTGTPAVVNGTTYALQLFVVSIVGTPTLFHNVAGANHRIWQNPDTGGPNSPLNFTPDLSRDEAIIATFTAASSFIPQTLGYVVT